MLSHTSTFLVHHISAQLRTSDISVCQHSCKTEGGILACCRFLSFQGNPRLPNARSHRRSHVLTWWAFVELAARNQYPQNFNRKPPNEVRTALKLCFERKACTGLLCQGGGGVFLPLKRKQNTEDAQPSLAISMMTQFRSSTAAKGKLVGS